MRVSRTDFARLIQHVTKAVESRNVTPVLSCVKIELAAGLLTATATDLDVEITGTIEADGDDAAFCVNAKTLSGIVAKLAADHIDITPADTRVTIKAGRSRFVLDTLPAADYPTISAGAFDVEFTADLAALFAPVQFAISNEEARYYLNGINMQPGVVTATDGHRLATLAVDPWPAHTPIIVPRKMVGLMLKGECAVAVSAARIRVESGGVTITSKVIDGTFPDYERVIPKDNDKHITVDNAALRAAAERVAVIADDRGRAVKLVFAGGGVELSVRGSGEADDAIECDYSGEPTYVGFNVMYLVEALGSLPAGPVVLSLFDSGTPALLTSPAAPGVRVVLMPMRIG